MSETFDDSANDTGIGALLRASRMRIGEDLRDVADILRIRYPYLRAIEEDRFNDLPGQPYAVGFVRAYADHLGLDGEEVVKRFKEEFSDGSNVSTELSFPTPVTEANVPGGAIIFIGLFMAILAYGFWYVSTSDENYLVKFIEPIPERLSSLVSSNNEKRSEKPLISDPVLKKPSNRIVSKQGVVVIEPGSREGFEILEQRQSLDTDTVKVNRESTQDTPPASQEQAAVAAEAAAPGKVDKSLSNSKVKPLEMAETPATELAPTSPATVANSSAPQRTIENPKPMATPPTLVGSPAADGLGGSDITRTSDKPLPALSPTGQEVEIEQTTRAGDLVPESPDASTFDVSQAEASDRSPDPELSGISRAAVRSRILVRAKAESWVQVRDENDNIVFTDLLQAGQAYAVPDERGLRLETGNAGALEILVDGKVVPTIGEEGEVRRGVKLDPILLQAGSAANE